MGQSVYYPHYSIFGDEDTNDHCFNWTNPPCDVEAETYSFSYQGWKYTSPKDIWGVPIIALFNTYRYFKIKILSLYILHKT